MSNSIMSEIIKLKKNKMAYIGTTIVAVIPLLMIVKTYYLDRQRSFYMEWFMTVLMLNLLVLPIVSGFVITSSVQKEYQDKTLRNILTAPTSRTHFIFSKLTIWFLWHLITFILAEILTLIGGLFLFSDQISLQHLWIIIYLFSLNSLCSFFVMIPVLWVSIKQQIIFFPAILVSLGFTVLQMAGRQVSEEFVWVASICPWTAVSVLGMLEPGTFYFWIGMWSITICGILGICMAVYTFKKQDQF